MKAAFKDVFLEVTNHCNFDCTFCPSGIMKRKKQFIETKLAFKAIDQISDNNISARICFHLMGEPLLHPDLFKIVKHANRRKLHTILFTNGGLLTEKIIGGLFDAMPSELLISLHTPSEELFFLRNSNMTYEKYEKQIKDIIEKHASLKSTIKISLEIGTSDRTFSERFFLGKSDSLNVSEEDFVNNLDTFINFGNSITKKHYGYSIHEGNIPDLNDIINNYPIKRKITTICPNIEINYKRIDDWRDISGGYKVIFANCNPDHFGILCNGDVVLCCRDYDGETKIGNLYNEPLIDILTSNKMKRIRKAMSLNIMPTQFCRRCKGYTSIRATLASQLKALTKFLS